MSDNDFQPVYCIFDTLNNTYVIRNVKGYGGGGSGRKCTWLTPGAAKNAANILISGEWYDTKSTHTTAYRDWLDAGAYNSGYGRPKPPKFKDQSRYEIHKMKLVFSEKVVDKKK